MHRIAFFLLCLTTLVAGQITEIPDQSKLEILSPDFKGLQTAKFRLENGLEVYLISDPKATDSAASLAVEVGSFDEEKGKEGIAHFTEHLLFMGSKKYPEENLFSEYVNNYRGFSNAYTANDATVYGFTCTHEGFEVGLDIFSRFFIDPTFNPSGVDRELKAIDEEYAKNLENDSWREWMVLKELCNKNHPISVFTIGNKQTLSHMSPEQVCKWYQEHYSADKMHLNIVSNQRIEVLKEWVVRMFSPVPKCSYQRKITATIFEPSELGKMVYVQPIGDLRTLGLIWQITPQFDRQSELMVARILNAKTDGSLFAALKKEGLIEGLLAHRDIFSKDQGVFAIELGLTRKGLQERERVLDLTFSYLSYLREHPIPSYIYNEFVEMQKWNYAFSSRGVSYQVAMRNAHQMVYFPLAAYPDNLLLPDQYRPAAYSTCVQHLIPEKCMMVVVAPSSATGVYPDRKEKWIGGEYAIQSLDQERLTELASRQGGALFHMPVPSKYIPTKLEPSSTISEPNDVPPKLISETKLGKLYHLQDHRFCTPKVALIFNLITPAIDTSARSQVLVELYTRAVYEAMAQEQALAAEAGLGASLAPGECSLVLSIDGYAQKSGVLLKNYLTTMRRLKVSQEQFSEYYDAIYSHYESNTKAIPIQTSIETYFHLLQNDKYTSTQLLEAMQGIHYEAFLDFVDRLFDSVYVESLMTGNIGEKTAQSHFDLLRKTLKASPLKAGQRPELKVLTLSPDTDPLQINLNTQMQGSSAILSIQTGLYSPSKIAMNALLGSVLSPDFFDTLRTKQQVGYIVQAKDLERRGALFLLFLAQSSTHSSSELVARFELFLEQFSRDPKSSVSEERFNQIKSALIQQLSQPTKSLSENALYYFALAYQRGGDFTRKEKVIEAVKEIDYETFCGRIPELVGRSNKRRLAILMEGKATEDKTLRYQRTSLDWLRGSDRYVAENAH